MPKPRLSNQKLEQFVNRYVAEFDEKLSNEKIISYLFSPQKRARIILEKVLRERSYTLIVETFTSGEIKELLAYLEIKIEIETQKRLGYFCQNIIGISVFGLLGGILSSISLLNLLWLLPLAVIWLIKFFKKNKNYCEIEATYSSLKDWVKVYQLRRN